MSRLLTLLCVLLLAMPAAFACNPSPPQPPVLEGYAWDATAAGQLQRDARSIVKARFRHRLDLEFGEPTNRPRADYVFEVTEGWKAATPRSLTLAGHWVSCRLELKAGGVLLLYLDGDRLMHAVPLERLDFEPGMLGEPDWFFDAGGRLVVPAEAETDTGAEPEAPR